MAENITASPVAQAELRPVDPPATANDQVREQESQTNSNNDLPSMPDLVSLDQGSSYGSIRSKPLRQRLKVALHLARKSSLAGPQISYSHRLRSKIRALDEFPAGYSKVAAIEDSHPNFLMYRKFGWLHGYLLLHRQDELVVLEDDLERIDNFDYENDPLRLKSRRRDNSFGARRKELLQEIEIKLKEYDELLLRYQQINAIKQPTSRDQNSLYNMIHNTESLPEMEAEWIRCTDDLVALDVDHEIGWFNGFLEDILSKISRSAVTAVFRTKSQRIRTGDEFVLLSSRSRFNSLIYSIITILATVLLLAPVFILYQVKLTNLHQILVIFAFTLVFSACCAIFTKAKRQEIFAATAAYCAVLVVFLGNTAQTVYLLPDGSTANAALLRS